MSHCTTHHPECCNVTMMSKAYAMLLIDLFDKNFAGGGGGGKKVVASTESFNREERGILDSHSHMVQGFPIAFNFAIMKRFGFVFSGFLTVKAVHSLYSKPLQISSKSRKSMRMETR